MINVHVLTSGFRTPNAKGFLFPLIRYKKALKSCGINIKFFTNEKENLIDCDVLILESKYFSKQWRCHTSRILEKLSRFQSKVNKLYFFDINDSSTWPHARALPYVDGYFKNQLLKDRSCYLKSFYGNRVYTDYYHQHYHIHDNTPAFSEIVSDSDLLSKLALGWNSGLADYSMHGPYKMLIYKHFPWKDLLSYSKALIKPSITRENEISCRMGITYQRNTIACQRQCIKDKLASCLKTDKLSRRKYMAELINSKIVISPFGLGEITLKDFEVFLTGGLLLKPDMEHMQTWPDFFQSNKTMITHKWDLTDLDYVITDLISNYHRYIDIAIQAQNLYKKYTVAEKAEELFCNHFSNILRFQAGD